MATARQVIEWENEWKALPESELREGLTLYIAQRAAEAEHAKVLQSLERHGTKYHVQVGWTNMEQISYMRNESDGGGSVYPDQECGCTIPVFVPTDTIRTQTKTAEASDG